MAASIAETVARDRLPAEVILSPPFSTVPRSRTSALRATGDRVSSYLVRSFARRSARFSAEGSSIRPSRLARSSMAQAGSRPPSHVARSGFGRLSGAITAGWLRALRDREGGPASVRVSRRRPPCARHAPERRCVAEAGTWRAMGTWSNVSTSCGSGAGFPRWLRASQTGAQDSRRRPSVPPGALPPSARFGRAPEAGRTPGAP